MEEDYISPQRSPQRTIFSPEEKALGGQLSWLPRAEQGCPGLDGIPGLLYDF